MLQDDEITATERTSARAPPTRTSGTMETQAASSDLEIHAYSGRTSAIEFLDIKDMAEIAASRDPGMSMRYALRYYKPALAWALLMACPVIMEGYEMSLMASFFAFEPFVKHYGGQFPELPGEDYHNRIPPEWSAGVISGSLCGQLIGLAIVPHIVNRLGYRRSTRIALAWVSVCFLIKILSMQVSGSRSLKIYMAGEILLGVGWGLFQGGTLPYISDIMPMRLKMAATNMMNVFWLLGLLLSSASLRAAAEIDSEWAMRVPMLLQYIWIIPLLAVSYFAPESPQFLNRRGRNDEARMSLQRLTRDPLYDVHGSLALIQAANDQAAELERPGLRGLFPWCQGSNLRRTEICVAVYLTQQLIGTPMIAFSLKILQKSGVESDISMYLVMGMYALCMGLTTSSICLAKVLRRRTMWMGGLAVAIICLAIIASLGFAGKNGWPDKWWPTCIVLVVFAGTYNATVGPLSFTIVAETPSSRCKSATNSFARSGCVLIAAISMYVAPKLMVDSPNGMGLGLKTALL